ncbi:SubName: Full=Uncharacterized protein {ECO:0000313/EMBL:CCA71507.1} [Serendipita indica DSM 11827]|uniref:Uncharacterized protein n=1 Tax=Serendipita indica (strain DSM 11827) TaxID=1109443 RepID=G4TJJ4_SERID|nr:SubName: Full=Uncharacterized protein {ECO:0000313/EMBL:CCA71507.1} [Serendipita indica DSM 11827]CCA71507.1 hypothetical protein PIIN_05444 [Serendipita indica DSM 11827]
MTISVSNPPSSHDLSTPDGIHAYLRESSPFNPSNVELVTGGMANWTFRATLGTPAIQDEALSRALGDRRLESIIIKHSKDRAAAFHGWTLDLERVNIELAAPKLVATLPLPHSRTLLNQSPNTSKPDEPSISVTEQIWYDAGNHIQCMIDFGRLHTLKSFFIANPGPSNVSLAQQAGKALGEFLAGLHLWSWPILHSTRDKETVLEMYQKNVWAKEACALRTIGSLKASAEQAGVPGKWDEIVQALTKEVTEIDEVFNIGDLWTGNVLIETNENHSLKALYIVDWEVAKTGTASTDIAQFAAEAYQLWKFSSSDTNSTTAGSPAGEALARSFLSGYQDHVTSSLAAHGSSLSDSTSSTTRGRTVKQALLDGESVIGHLCAHVATIGRDVSWAKDTSTTKSVVKKALNTCASFKSLDEDALERKPGLDKVWDDLQ